MNEDRNMRVGCMHEKRDILMSTIPIFFSFHKTNVWLLISGGFTMVSMGYTLGLYTQHSLTGTASPSCRGIY